jgi:hypothetical protein
VAGALVNPLKSVAQTLCRVLGTTAVMKRVNSSYNPATGVETAADPASTTWTLTIAPPEMYSAREINGTTILAGDVKITVAAKDVVVAPQPNFSLTVGSDVYRVVTVETVDGGGSAVIYILQCRK